MRRHETTALPGIKPRDPACPLVLYDIAVPRDIEPAGGALPGEGTFRAHQVPLAEVRSRPDRLALLEQWMRSYKPEEQSDRDGRLVPELAALAPQGDRRMGGRNRYPCGR